ncbi:MAG: hypothetical protein ACRDOI_44785 [Trebonia sp.]
MPTVGRPARFSAFTPEIAGAPLPGEVTVRAAQPIRAGGVS